MIRFIEVAGNPVQVLEAPLHDAVATSAVFAALARLDPEEVAVDAPAWTWNALQRGRSRIDPVEDEVFRAIEGRSGIQPYALYEALLLWAGQEGRRVRLLSGLPRRPARRNLRPLVQALRREGISARTARGAADELRTQFLPRFPRMQDWYAARSARIVRDIQRSFAREGGVCLLTYPDGPVVGDLAQIPVPEPTMQAVDEDPLYAWLGTRPGSGTGPNGPADAIGAFGPTGAIGARPAEVTEGPATVVRRR